MSIAISKRISDIPFSSIRKVFEKAGEMEKRGIQVTHMEIGRPDFDTPDHIKRAAIEALEKGKVHYTPNSGIQELKSVIADKLQRDNNVIVDPDKGVVVTIGCKEAVFDTVMAFINPGDEVLIPDPSWLEYRYIVSLAGGIPVPVPLKEEENFLLNPEDVRDRMTKRTKMLMLNSPQNPTGAVLPKAYLKELADIAIQHNLLILSDEIYEKLIYDNEQHVSIASLPGMNERTVIINGFSKTYAMDGWRLGYAAGPSSLIQPILKVHQYNTSSATSFVQYGGTAAYLENQEKVSEMVGEFDRRRQLVVGRLEKIKGVHCVVPKGAFYVFPSFKSTGISSSELANLLLEKAHIACVPGDVFGEYGKGYIRMAYSINYEQLVGAMDQLSDLIDSLGKQH